MPTVGTDHCFTCKFNVWNNDVFKSDYCRVRTVPIRTNLMETFCANHPERNPDGEHGDFPIGPMTVHNHEAKEPPKARSIEVESPDTPQIRDYLLNLLAEIEEVPDSNDWGHFTRDEVVIWQLASFGEARALDDLRRIASFNPDSKADESPRTRQHTVRLAKRAIRAIENASDIGEFGAWASS